MGLSKLTYERIIQAAMEQHPSIEDARLEGSRLKLHFRSNRHRHIEDEWELGENGEYGASVLGNTAIALHGGPCASQVPHLFVKTFNAMVREEVAKNS